MTGVFEMETTINATCMLLNKLVAKVYNKKVTYNALTAKVLTYKTLRIFMQRFLFYFSIKVNILSDLIEKAED